MASSKALFRVAGGLDDGQKYYLSGAGVPGGDSSYQDNAPRGSQYQDTSTGDLYIKINGGAGAGTWTKLATQANLDQLVTGISWREPVVVTDTSLTTVAEAVTALNGAGIQSQTVAAGDRILLAGLTGATPNVYIVGGSTGSFTLTADTNTATSGDTVHTLFGDNSGKMYTYYETGPDTGWHWTASMTTSEDGFIRAFIGKNGAGSEMPSYTSNFHVANSDSLETAIGKLDAAVHADDAAIAALQSASNALQTEVDNIETTLGGLVGNDGTWAGGTAFSGTSYLSTGVANVTQAFTKLDTTINNLNTSLSNEITNRIADVDAEEARAIAKENSLQAELDATQAGAGLAADGTYVQDTTGTTYIGAATSLADADHKLDVAIKTVADLVNTNNTNIQTEVDNLETSTGMNADGTFSAYTGTNYINAATSMKNADVLLDAAIKARADAIAAEVARATAAEAQIAADLVTETNARTAADAAIQAELDATQAGAGLTVAGAYVANGSANYISTATSLKDADDKLDAALKVVADTVAANNTSLQTEVDLLETATGMNANGSFSPYSGTNYIDSATSMKNADVLLDAAIKAEVDARTAAVSAEATARSTADAALQTELDATQASVGSAVNANGTWAGFSSTNYLNSAASITGALTELDSQLKATTDAATTELDAFEASVGVNTDGTLAAWGGTNTYVTGTMTFKAGVDALDVQLKTVTDGLAAEITNRTTAVTNEATARAAADALIQAELDALELATGQNADGSFSGYTGTHYLNAATSLKVADTALDTNLFRVDTNVGDLQYTSTNKVTLGDSVTVAISKLDAALASSVAVVTSNNITTATVVDSIKASEFAAAKWIVTITKAGDHTVRETAVVLGLHNGETGVPATVADYTIYGQLRTNGAISGLTYWVDIDTSGPEEMLVLKVSSTAAVDFRALRLRVSI